MSIVLAASKLIAHTILLTRCHCHALTLQFKEVLETVEEMLAQRRVLPDIQCYTIAMHACSALQQTDRAAVRYAANLLKAALQQQQQYDARSSSSNRTFFQLDSQFCSEAINVFTYCGDWQSAAQVLREMQRLHLQLQPVWTLSEPNQQQPAAVVGNTSSSCPSEHLLQMITQLIDDCIASGTQPSAVMLQYAVQSACSAGLVTRAVAALNTLLRTLDDSSKDPCIAQSYKAVISTAATYGPLHLISTLFESMRTRGMAPTHMRTCYAAAIDALSLTAAQLSQQQQQCSSNSSNTSSSSSSSGSRRSSTAAAVVPAAAAKYPILALTQQTAAQNEADRLYAEARELGLWSHLNTPNNSTAAASSTKSKASSISADTSTTATTSLGIAGVSRGVAKCAVRKALASLNEDPDALEQPLFIQVGRVHSDAAVAAIEQLHACGLPYETHSRNRSCSSSSVRVVSSKDLIDWYYAHRQPTSGRDYLI
jgi:hypothetical protein